MNGINHVKNNICSLITAADICFLNNIDIIPKISENSSYFIPCVGIAFIIGSLLPDIDHPNSEIGKFIHLPIKHRTWTHAIYIPVILFLLSIKYKILFWLGLGYFGHLFWDSFSSKGNNWLYPIKNKFHLKLYSTGNTSETIVTIFNFIFTIFLTIFIIYKKFYL